MCIEHKGWTLYCHPAFHQSAQCHAVVRLKACEEKEAGLGADCIHCKFSLALFAGEGAEQLEASRGLRPLLQSAQSFAADGCLTPGAKRSSPDTGANPTAAGGLCLFFFFFFFFFSMS